MPQPGDSLLYEIFSKSGDEYIRVTFNGQAVYLNGISGGVLDLNSFFNYIYDKEYGGDEELACKAGNAENPEDHVRQPYSSFDDYVGSIYDIK